ncbi:glycosyltransferase family 4 protein [Leeia sp.]|uniref:glycosyltransferase family 4 protein n=1 Tax=Leeia sp. TaxID=2884678 RepID=UPI0035B484E4
MRIAYLNPQAVPDTLPSTLQILQTVEALGLAGVQVDLVTPQARNGHTVASLLGRALPPQVQLHPLPDYRKRWFFPFASHRPFYWQAVRWLRQHPVDAVYVRNLKLAEVLLRAFSSRLPIFFETHELFAQTLAEQLPEAARAQHRKLLALRAREGKVYREVKGLITITQTLLDDIRAEYALETPAWVAPDGVDLTLARQVAPREQGDRPLPVLLYLGSLHPWKGVDALVEAMTQVASAELWVAGGGAERLAALQQRAAQLGISHRIRWLGFVPPRERFTLIAQADICVLPLSATSIGSRYTSPLKLFEYMAMGKPVLVRDVPAIREVITHGENGYLYTDEAHLPTAIQALLSQPEQWPALGKAAAESAQHYAWSCRAEGIIRFMKSVVSA